MEGNPSPAQSDQMCALPKHRSPSIACEFLQARSAQQPDKELIVFLGLDPKLTYATLPESGELQKGLALRVGLPEKAGYAEITERFVEHAEEFLKDVQSRNLLSKVNWGRVSLIDFAH